jgi:hypothetical protein
MWNRRHRWIRRLAAGLAFAALVVPTAQAKIVDDSGIGTSGQPPVAYDGYGYQQSSGVPVDQQSPPVVIVGDWGLASQADTGQVAVRPDDRSVRFTPEAGNPQVVAAPSSGFDWSDAGIGAGSAVGLMLLALGAALATRHSGRKELAGA